MTDRNTEPQTGLVPTTLSEATELSKLMSQSTLLPIELAGKPADVFVTIMAGRELGLSPMSSIRGIHVIKGRPSLSADLMVAIVRRSGLCKYWVEVESTSDRAVYETHRVGDPIPQRASFTRAQALAAHLLPGKPDSNWQKYPEAMLRARAKSTLARKVYEDLLFGCYTDDENEAIDLVQTGPSTYSPPPPVAAPPAASPVVVDVEPEPTEPAPAVPEPAPTAEPTAEMSPALAATQAAELARAEPTAAHIQMAIEAATTLKVLDSLSGLGSKLPKGEERDALAALFYERRTELRELS